MPPAGSADTTIQIRYIKRRNVKSVTDRVQQLKRSYSRRLPGRVRELERLWRQVAERQDPEILAVMLETTHNLAGSGGVYGYPQVSAISRDLHQALLQIKKEKRAPRDEERRHIEECIRKLLQEATPQ